MVKARMDGLQVLKGGLSKATIYFETKEATKNALDLNEQEIEIGVAKAFTPDVSEGSPETIEDIEKYLEVATDTIIIYQKKLFALLREQKQQPELFIGG